MKEPNALLRAAFEQAMQAAAMSSTQRDWNAAISSLSTAHILGQRTPALHWRVHVAMLRVGWARKDRREVAGQLMRLALVPVGHLSGRLPIGNPGHAGVSAFEPMEIPPELKALLERSEL